MRNQRLFRHYEPRGPRCNHQIRAFEIRLIGPQGENLGVMTTRSAMQKAMEVHTDLVEISPNATPPVCRLINRGKFLYQKEKRHQENRKHASSHLCKEIQFRPNIAANDFQTKIRHAIEFLQVNAVVKVIILLRGRENAHPEIATELARHIIDALKNFGITTDIPRVLNRTVSLKFQHQAQKPAFQTSSLPKPRQWSGEQAANPQAAV